MGRMPIAATWAARQEVAEQPTMASASEDPSISQLVDRPGREPGTARGLSTRLDQATAPCMNRRRLLASVASWPLLGLLVPIWAGAGCSSPFIRGGDKESTAITDDEKEIRLVRDMTRIWGLRPTKIEGVALVSQLENTGSDPPVSAQRDMLMDDMQRRRVSDPKAVLASPTTALVFVTATLKAGTRKGERLDVVVKTPSRSDTESLRHGWLMPSRLQEMAVLGNRLRQGRVMGYAEGSVIVDALLGGSQDARAETTGRVLGGAVSNVTRHLGLVLTSEHHSVRASALVGAAVNARFHTFDRGTKRGVATPKRDNFIELAVHNRYRNNLLRYVRVVQAVPVRETPRELMDRLTILETRLLDPHTTVAAAVDLEAIGPEALPSLRKGLESSSPLCRFASAEALAYMNEVESVPHLVDAALREPAFRWHAITAMSAMTESDARDGLAALLHATSDETRYGAFKGLMDFNPRDPAIQGEILGDTMALHMIASDAEPLVHVRKTERPEVVLFGKTVSLTPPAVVFAGSRMMVQADDAGRVRINYFTMGEGDRTEHCDNSLADIIRTIVRLGGSYADVVSAISDAKQKGVLTARVKFDAIPQPGREYELDAESNMAPDDFDPGLDAEDEEDIPAGDELAVGVKFN